MNRVRIAQAKELLDLLGVGLMFGSLLLLALYGDVWLL